MKTKNIILIGGGGHCSSVIDVIEQENKYTIAGIVDVKKRVGEMFMSYEIIGTDEDLVQLREKYEYAFIALGHIDSNRQRVAIFETLQKLDFLIPTIISPLAYVSKHAKIASATIVMHHALVNANASIGKNCIINSKALVEHDVTVEDNVHISTSAVLNGGVRVKEHTFVGSNATVRESLNIEGFIKAGSLVK